LCRNEGIPFENNWSDLGKIKSLQQIETQQLNFIMSSTENTYDEAQLVNYELD
jgi:mannose-1-phosphate guanylyltransferase